MVLALVAGLAAGCQAQRQERCSAFAAAADACYVSAGLSPFFEANVDCVDPASTLREYTCLLGFYEGASCRTAAAAYALVDEASLECLGWNEELSGADDDDSAR